MAPKVIRRPAGVPRLRAPLRRPAVHVISEEERGRGPLSDGELVIGSLIHGEEGAYYNTPCQFSGRVIEVVRDASGQYIVLKLLGTNLESLLTCVTGTTHHARVHICDSECSQEAVGPGLIHCKKYRIIGSLEDLEGHPWRDVLVGAGPREGDELAGLRGRMDALPEVPGEGRAAASKVDKEGIKEKEKKKEKKKKRRRQRRRSSSPDSKKRRRSRSSRSRRRESEKKKKAAEGDGAKDPVRSSSSSSTSSSTAYTPVDQKRLFAHSGLDPVKKLRNRQRRKAQRYAQRSRPKKDDSQSSTSGDGAGFKGQTIFGEHQRVRGVALNFPGVLSAQAIEDMQELMLTEAGHQTSQHEGWVPTLLRYYRQMLSRRVSGPMSRELLTLCTVADLVIRGLISDAMDTLIQRVKSLEAQANGMPWTSAQRLEILPSDAATLSSRQELKIATTEQKAEAQAHQTGSWWGKGSGKDHAKGEKTDKGKGKGKKGKEKPKKD